MKVLRVILIILLITNYQSLITLNAQIAINTDGSTPDASAMLEVSSTDKGMLIPRMTTSQRANISNPATGLMVYDTDFNSFWYYANSTWNNLSNANFSDADSDTKILVEQNTDDDSIRFYTGGTEYFSMHDGRLSVANTGKSVFIGDSAGINDDLSINLNSFVGYISGKSNTTGYYNSFYGANTGYSNTTGYMNTFVGTSSGALNTTGANNTFYGGRSGSMNTTGSANLFLGRTAGFFNTTGSDNIFIGYSAGFSNETGNNNTLIGREAGFNNTSGSSNIFLGYKAGYSETGSNKLYIDNSDTIAPLIYGEFDNDLLKINGQFNVTDTVTLSSALLVNVNGQDLANTAFTSENGITHNINNSDDFVIGADSINYVGSGSELKMFFDKGQSAFRTGRVNNTNWNEDSLGLYSFATGNNTLATGSTSAAFGYQTTASGIHSIAGGNQSEATANLAFAYGREMYARSFGEIALGLYGTDYTPNETLAFDTNDRLFSLGNGTANNSRSDAMIIYKNGNTEINGALTLNNAFTFPTADGSANKVLKTDGNGTLSWGDGNLISDDDADTKILVEESTDEDVVRFYTGGTEYFKMSDGRLSVTNTGGDIFIGDNAGVSLGVTNHYNTVIGDNALNDYTSSSYYNTAIGASAGKGNSGQIVIGNIFIGYDAGKVSEVSNRNVIVGYEAGKATTVSGNNVLIGSASGSSLTTGNNNVMLGTTAGSGVNTGSGNVMLGNQAGGISNVSNELFIDNSNTESPLIWGDFDDNDVVINGALGVNITPSNAIVEIDGTTGSAYSYSTSVLSSSGVSTVSSNAYLSLYAHNTIAANKFVAHSDRRIKNIKGVSNGKKDLEILNSIEITDYTMIDTIQKGTKPFKKVIAQQVAEVFPQAITKGLTEVVPDIYQHATIDENGWIMGCQLPVDSCQLKVGEEVKIIFDNEEEILEVLEVNENTFRVEPSAANLQSSTVFVYGRQVTDFHTVDYEAISMLNVSATQQLAKDNQQLKAENENLKQRVTELEQQINKVNELEAKLEVLLNNQ